MNKDIEEFLKELEKADERFQKEKELYKDELMEEDESFHVSHAEAYVIQDENLFPRNGKEPITLEEARKAVERLRKTDYFGNVDESFFIDDVSAPPRYTEEYRQWWEYQEAKGHYNLLGNSPSPYESLYNNELGSQNALEGKKNSGGFLGKSGKK